MKAETLKPVCWVGSSRKDVRSFPRPVRVAIGVALYAAQRGDTDPSAKALKGFGGGSVVEIVTSHIGDAWRNRHGPAAARGSRARPPGKAERSMPRRKGAGKVTPQPRVTDASANVFADLGLRNPDQELMKARLTLEIFRIIRQRGITQSEAAAALGVKQPQVSLLMRNRGNSFSVGRLLEFLTDLGQDVEVTVRPTRREHGEMSVNAGLAADH